MDYRAIAGAGAAIVTSWSWSQVTMKRLHNQCCGAAFNIMRIRIPTFLHMDPDPGSRGGTK